ncbi:endonuclease/exonuclease/phosphatase family protein [Peloplasma aerotolerans]|uniref:Endonuclease/exonuclease/phosphatase family protein n=1 Tax=Peloplasma aerotolerans TaxID=3044389 RepID=A0AAW6U8Z3_9MOLU|nr:endonuclease/exonuclease/phosphatase family protein [Mariniplasma sp. M4Ah]MDI6453385.1 endonuclease/exonuclease/phosphatase family protein [Mariniplasma sp. M4Ah]
MKIVKLIIKLFIGVFCIVGLFIAVLTIFEYRPDDIEDVDILNNKTQTVSLNESLTFMTFNIGYAGLGKDEDFVMDGGKSGRPDSKETVLEYLEGIQSILSEYQADFYLLQEVDQKARRSYSIQQVESIAGHLGDDYSTQFAYNFNVMFVPFPVSFSEHIGYVKSGLATYVNFAVESSERLQFPGAFSWPLRVANLKRAMMVSYLDITDSDKQLVIVNLHMSAYDGDGSLRAQEMDFLKAFMEAEYEKGNYVIVGGDFNQTFPEAVGVYEVIQDYYVAYPIEDNFLPNGFSFQVDVTTPSCRLLNQPYDPNHENTQYYIIDGFIVSDNITVEKYFESQDTNQAVTLDLGFEHSDHNPVVMKIRLLP